MKRPFPPRQLARLDGIKDRMKAFGVTRRDALEQAKTADLRGLRRARQAQQARRALDRIGFAGGGT